MTKTYYNEFDPKAAAWLRELISGGHIPAGDVDTRSIVDVKPEDLYDYDQCHFFAGIGGWAYALQLAGWSGPVWTGSCPCQPFSNAGSQRGTADERHLWPQFARLIAECQPPVVFGEQVASKAGREWLAGVRTDLEGMAYAVGAADLCAAGVGAPHIRQRLFWVADAHNPGPQGWGLDELRERTGERVARQGGGACGVGKSDGDGWVEAGCDFAGRTASDRVRGADRTGDGGSACGVDNPASSRLASERCREPGEPERRGSMSGMGCETDGMEHTSGDGRVKRGSESSGRGTSGGCVLSGVGLPDGSRRVQRVSPGAASGHGCPTLPTGDPNFWSGYELVPCRDGKVRRIEPGTFPLAYGVSGRVGLLRGYGNAIVPEVAAEFVAAFLEGRTYDVLHGK